MVSGLCFVSSGVVAQEEATGKPTPPTAVSLLKTDEPVKIDGVLDEACWKAAEPVRMEFAYGKLGVRSEPLPAKVYYAWDHEYLYVGYETFDTTLRAAGSGEEEGAQGNSREACAIGGSNDVFEIFVSFDDPHFFWELHHNAANNFSDIWVTVAGKDWPLHRSSRAYQGIIWSPKESLDYASLETAVRPKRKKDGKPGTVNQDDDVDAGYVGELRFSWKSLGAPKEWLRGADKIDGKSIVLFAAVQDGAGTPRYHHTSPHQKITGFFHTEAAGWPRYRLVDPERDSNQ
ncbi:MAG: hypothetical protein QGH29_11120 [Kiritimatiellia bacterium]|nr:hypothetical protein [Kiritimatiellia bacterium]